MEKKVIISIFSVIIASIVLGLGSWYLYKYFRRYAVLHLQKEADQKIDHELAELQALGFGPESEAIAALKARYSWQGHKQSSYAQASADRSSYAQTSRRQGYGGHGALADKSDRQALSHLLALNKKMLMSYISEGKSFKKQKVDPQSNLMKFTHDKIVRLTIAVVELERQLRDNELEMSEYEKRVHRMKEITRQSVSHYKKKLREYQRLHLASHDERLQAAQAILTTRLKHLAALEKAVI